MDEEAGILAIISSRNSNLVEFTHWLKIPVQLTQVQFRDTLVSSRDRGIVGFTHWLKIPVQPTRE